MCVRVGPSHLRVAPSVSGTNPPSVTRRRRRGKITSAWCCWWRSCCCSCFGTTGLAPLLDGRRRGDLVTTSFVCSRRVVHARKHARAQKSAVGKKLASIAPQQLIWRWSVNSRSYVDTLKTTRCSWRYAPCSGRGTIRESELN